MRGIQREAKIKSVKYESDSPTKASVPISGRKVQLLDEERKNELQI